MDYIIIKLYLNGIQGDCHDIHIEDFEESFKKMQDYARSINRKLYFAPLTSDQECGLPVDCTPFAEIEYTGVLSEAEKKIFHTYYEKARYGNIACTKEDFKVFEESLYHFYPYLYQ